MTETPKDRAYFGKGTADKVAAQMIGAFTDAGYEISDAQPVDKDIISVTFTKGSTKIRMIVSNYGGGKGTVACILGLSS